MASETPVLAFDTSAAHCAAALLLGDRVIVRVEEMARGQAERLMPMLSDLLMSESLAFPDLGRIGVGVGPGNFTGIRISVSAARGLGLSLGIPVIGVSCLTALQAIDSRVAAAISAPRDMAYLQVGKAQPVNVPFRDVPSDAAWMEDPAKLVVSIARLARAAPADSPPPKPLYLKPADAAPSRDRPPVILHDG